MAESNKLSDRGIVAEGGVIRVAEYDRVGELRLMEHLVLVEAGLVFRGRVRTPPTPISTDVRRTIIEPSS